MLDFNIHDIKFEEIHIEEEQEEIGEMENFVAYFIAPKEYCSWELPKNCVSAEISVSGFGTVQSAEAKDCYVEISPTIYSQEEDCLSDIDWRDWDIPYEWVEQLLDLAIAAGKENE